MSKEHKIENALPCPFCGGTNLAYISELDELTGDKRNVDFIACMNKYCFADGRISINKKDALKNWNTRH